MTIQGNAAKKTRPIIDPQKLQAVLDNLQRQNQILLARVVYLERLTVPRHHPRHPLNAGATGSLPENRTPRPG